MPYWLSNIENLTGREISDKYLTLSLANQHWSRPWMAGPTLALCRLCISLSGVFVTSSMDLLLSGTSFLWPSGLTPQLLALELNFPTESRTPFEALPCLCVALCSLTEPLCLLCLALPKSGKLSPIYYPCPSLTTSKLLNHLWQLTTATLEFEFPTISNSWWLQVCSPTPIEVLIISRWGFSDQD